jgi:hypothetical protein
MGALAAVTIFFAFVTHADAGLLPESVDPEAADPPCEPELDELHAVIDPIIAAQHIKSDAVFLRN